MKHTEIERKYLLTAPQHRVPLLEKISQLPGFKTAHTVTITSCDTYVVVPQGLPYIYRYRSDQALQELTVKSLADSFPVRQEITIKLATQFGQKDAIAAFFATLNPAWQGEIIKQLTAFRFDDCEVVIYNARHGTHDVDCLEIESLKAASVDAALATIEGYQRALNVDAYAQESAESIFQLLLYPHLPAALQQLIAAHRGANPRTRT